MAAETYPVSRGLGLDRLDPGSASVEETIASATVTAVRLSGARCVIVFTKSGFSARIVAARARAPFTSLEQFARSTALPKRALILLADADAFRSLGLDRRQGLWEVRGLPKADLVLMQNPPAFPTLAVSWSALRQKGTRFVVANVERRRIGKPQAVAIGTQVHGVRMHPVRGAGVFAFAEQAERGAGPVLLPLDLEPSQLHHRQVLFLRDPLGYILAVLRLHQPDRTIAQALGALA